MGKLNINNGGVDTNKAMPNIDERYGPYNSFDEANAALGGSGRNVIVAGLKVGIRQSDGSVKEYFYQPNGNGQLELVASTGIPEQGAANDKVLGYENGKVAWVEKPVDGDDAYHVWLEANGYDEKDHPVSEYNEYNRGKSAREIYNATYNKNLNDAQFAAELKMNYPMLHVGYNESNAGETVGVPFTGNLDPSGDNIGASESTMGKLYLMPDDDSDPENCIGFVTVLDGSTYKWCNVGAISIPSDALAKSDVDNECTDGATDEPASAKVVMDLKAKLEGVTASETKVNAEVGTNVTVGAYVSGETGLLVTPDSSASSYAYFELAIPQGTKSIRFATGTKTSAAKIGYSIGHYEENVYVPTRMFYFDVAETTPPSGIVEKIIEVLEGETTFMTTVASVSTYTSITLDKFYCYLQSGTSVGEELYKNIETRLDQNESLLKGRFINAYNQWSTATTARHIEIEAKVGETYIIKNNSQVTNLRFALCETRPTGTGSVNCIDATGYASVISLSPKQERKVVIPQNCYLCVNKIDNNGGTYNPQIFLIQVYNCFEYVDQIKEEVGELDNRVSDLEKSDSTYVSYNWEAIKHENNPGIISKSKKTWQTGGSHYIFELDSGTKYVKITKKSGVSQGYYTFFNTYSYTEGNPYPTSTYAQGYTTTAIQKSKELILEVPENANYLYTNTYAERVDTSFRKTANVVGGFKDYSEKFVKNQILLLQNNSVTNYAIKVDDNGKQLPTSRQMDVLLRKASIMRNFEWTPKVADRIRKSYSGSTPVFYPAEEQTGIPYSGNNAMSVGFGVSLYTFKTAVDNKYSLMYTEHLQDANSAWNVLDESTYGTVRHLPPNDHSRCYYGSYCNAFAAMCTGIEVPVGCGSYDNNAKYYDIVTKVANAFKDIRIGDVFSSDKNPTHTKLVTGVGFDENGDLSYLQFTEATGKVTQGISPYTEGDYGVVVMTFPTKASSNSYLDTLKGSFGHYRVNEIYRNWDINDELVFDVGNYIEHTKVCTFAGDKATFLKGDMVVINFDLDENSTFNETYLHLDIYNEDGGWEEVTRVKISDIPNQSYPSFNNYVNNYIGHCWAIPQEYIEGGKYRVYANNGTSASSEPDEATYFEVLTEDYHLTGEGDDIIVKYEGNGDLYGAYLYVYDLGAFSYLPLSEEEKEGQYAELHPETFLILTNSKYDGQKQFAIRLFVKGEYGCTRSNIIPYSSSVESDL